MSKVWAEWFLIIGLAAVFLYAALDSFFSPDRWIGFFPDWMRGIISDNMLLTIFSIYEIVLALWLLSRKWLFYSAILTSLTAAGIIIFNLGVFGVVFRDITIVFAGLALAVLSYEKNEERVGSNEDAGNINT